MGRTTAAKQQHPNSSSNLVPCTHDLHMQQYRDEHTWRRRSVTLCIFARRIDAKNGLRVRNTTGRCMQTIKQIRAILA